MDIIYYAIKAAIKSFLIGLKAKLKKENTVGRYLYIVTKGEEKAFFEKNDFAGGYNYRNIIKIFYHHYYPKASPVQITCDIINHEVLHQVLLKMFGQKVSKQLDNIHKPEGKPYNFKTKFVGI